MHEELEEQCRPLLTNSDSLPNLGFNVIGFVQAQPLGVLYVLEPVSFLYFPINLKEVISI